MSKYYGTLCMYCINLNAKPHVFYSEMLIIIKVLGIYTNRQFLLAGANVRWLVCKERNYCSTIAIVCDKRQADSCHKLLLLIF